MLNINQISVIAFDVATSLVDWRGFHEPFFRPDNPAIMNQMFTGKALAKTPIYDDAANLNFLAFRCGLAAVGYGSAAMHRSVATRLGLSWDFEFSSHECGQASDQSAFWQQLIQRSQKTFKVDPEKILLVTADSGETMVAARNAGLKTCFVPRPLVGTAAEAEVRKPDLMVSDLGQLEFGVMQPENLPVRYTVTAQAIYAKAAREFINWMRREHGAGLLKIKGCQEFRVYQKGPMTILAEYIFRDRLALETYLKEHAAQLRERTLEFFPPEIMQFERDIVPMLAAGSSRSISNFGG